MKLAAIRSASKWQRSKTCSRTCECKTPTKTRASLLTRATNPRRRRAKFSLFYLSGAMLAWKEALQYKTLFTNNWWFLRPQSLKSPNNPSILELVWTSSRSWRAVRPTRASSRLRQDLSARIFMWPYWQRTRAARSMLRALRFGGKISRWQWTKSSFGQSASYTRSICSRTASAESSEVLSTVASPRIAEIATRSCQCCKAVSNTLRQSIASSTPPSSATF